MAEVHFIKRNLPDFLTLSRLIAGLIILGLSFAGSDAYIPVVVITFAGAATDILDGRAARRFLGENREGRLGRYDILVDITFLFCVLAYFSLSGIVIPRALGLGWIFLSGTAVAVTRNDRRVTIFSQVVTVISLLVAALIYNPRIFGLVIVPVMAFGLLFNRRRVMYLVFEYWPALFFHR